MGRASMPSAMTQAVVRDEARGLLKDRLHSIVHGLREDTLTAATDNHRALARHDRIVDEMEAYAKTNLPGLPAANPDAPTDGDPGQLASAWFEYTPTGALDIAFGETMPDA